MSKGDGTETAPVALTVFFGANDACLPNRCSGFQHVPLHEYKDNLCSIVSFFKVTYFHSFVAGTDTSWLVCPTTVYIQLRHFFKIITDVCVMSDVRISAS